MISGLKSKIATLTHAAASSHGGSHDATAALNLRPTESAALAAARAPGICQAASPSAAAAKAAASAAAGAARAAAAVQIERLGAWKDSFLVRLTSAVHATASAIGVEPPAIAFTDMGNSNSSGSTAAAPDSKDRVNFSGASGANSPNGSFATLDRCGSSAGATAGSRGAAGSAATSASAPTTPRPLAAQVAALAAVARRARHLGSSSAEGPASASVEFRGGGGGGGGSGPPADSPRRSAVAAATEGVPGGAAAPRADGGGGATHLIVFANGLFGSPANWDVICQQLREHLDVSTVVLHPSQVNRRTDTYDGIDVCGRRLADEIRSVAAAHPSLQRISVIGHSMGGLLVRYAIGLLYCPSTGRIAGLRPTHFISMATPHMGCEADGLAQVPFIGWVPVRSVQRMLQVLSVPTAGALFRRTGRQFFMADGTSTPATGSSSSSSITTTTTGATVPTILTRGLTTATTSTSAPTPPSFTPAPASLMTQTPTAPASTTVAAATFPAASSLSEPLLYRMTQDDPSRGLYFYSALASFTSRTAYANTDGDHLVGWANSSLRFMHQLPKLPPEASRARGVVLQDPLLAAFDVRHKPDPEPQAAEGSADLPIDLPRPSSPPASSSRGGGTASVGRSMATAAAAVAAGSGGGGGSGGGAGIAPTAAATAAMAEVMLQRLQRLPWRRIDVSFKGALFGFAHNNIQVTRRWLNFEGMAVAHHLAQQVAALEVEWHRLEQGASPGQAPLPSPLRVQAQQAFGVKAPGAAARVVGAGAGALAAAPPLMSAPAAAASGRQPGSHMEWRSQQPLLSEAEAAEVELTVAAAATAAEAGGEREDEQDRGRAAGERQVQLGRAGAVRGPVRGG